MKSQFASRGAGHILVAMLGILVLPGCSRRMASTLLPNLPPELEIIDARADRTIPSDVRVRWAARDPDGSVARSCWTLAPMRQERPAGEVSSTRGQECVLARRAPVAARVAGTRRPEPDLFTVWAEDNRGAQSEHATVAMFGNNIAPSVQITCPILSDLVETATSSTVNVHWAGDDPDGVSTQKPVKYKWKLLSEGNEEFNFSLAMAIPDSLRRFYAANGWAGWDSLGGDSTSVAIPTKGAPPLLLGHRYLFVVTAFDETGDYDPVFSLNKNMFLFRVVWPQTLGPVLRVWNSSFLYQAVGSSWSIDPGSAVNLEVPWGAPLAFNVSGRNSGGLPLIGSRWALDPIDPHDQTVRSTPTDLRHWSEWSQDPLITFRVPSGSPIKGERHTLYIEGKGPVAGCSGDPAEEFTSLVMIRLVIVRATLAHELLIVDDARLEVDQRTAAGTLQPYTQWWPAAAELDTFLYARGGVPWRGTRVPATTVPQPVSPPGLFAGYNFDTLGTRGLNMGTAPGGLPQDVIPVGTIPLSLLANYRHVIWIADQNAALFTGSPLDLVRPMSALRRMSSPQHESVLAAYVAMGGKVWILGGAAAQASLIEFNAHGALSNDAIYGTGKTVFSSSSLELVPGRLMYDMPHVRSEIVAMSVPATTTPLVRQLGRFEGDPGAYAMFPAAFRQKSLAFGDSVPPTRTNSAQFYYPPSRAVEFLTQPNSILEDASPDPNFPDPQPALDSLYRFSGSSLPQTGESAVGMLNYHGRENGQFLWTGFDIWSFSRSDCQALVDGVLQGVWGMQRAPVARAARAGRTSPAPGQVK